MKHPLLFSIWLILCLYTVDGIIEKDGRCRILGVLPFTEKGKTSPIDAGLGYSHLAAIRLAMKQFNRRDPEIIPELPALLKGCNVYLDDFLSVDSQNGGHHAARTIINALSANTANNTIEEPCAFAGPHVTVPISEVSIIAQSLDIPLVAYGSVDTRLVNPYFHPYTSRTTSDSYSVSVALTDYVVHVHHRTDYIVVLYPLTDVGLQLREGIVGMLGTMNVTYTTLGYTSEASVVSTESPKQSLKRAAEQIKETGYRTVIALFDEALVEIAYLAEAAQQYGISNGDYFWLMFGQAGLYNAPDFPFQPTASLTNFLVGAAVVQPVENFVVNPAIDLFLSSWKSQGPTMVAEVNRLYPIKDQNESGYFKGEPDYFQKNEPSAGSGFIFDAVMAIGFGGCRGRDKSLNETSSAAHLRGIRSSKFAGATGTVAFQNTPGTPGSRKSAGLTFAAFNILGGDLTTEIAHLRTPPERDWIERRPFVYADGTEEPPALLRDEPEQNFLKSSSRIFGLVLLGIAWSVCIGNTVWIAVNRKHRVLTASQPLFLYQLALGSAVVVAAIFPLSFDESYGWSEEMLASACTSLPWLIVTGHVMQYMALFAKLWRINKVLQFRRTKVKLQHVIWPTGTLLVVSIVVLSIWTILHGFGWKRKTVDDDSGESIAFCSIDGRSGLWLVSCIPIMILPTGLATYMAWKTKDIDAAYSESGWIFTGILAQLQIIFLSIPILVILIDVSTDARHIGFCLMLFCYSTSLLSIIMFPKYLAWWRALHPEEQAKDKRGSSAGGVHVTGVNGNNHQNTIPLPSEAHLSGGNDVVCNET